MRNRLRLILVLLALTAFVVIAVIALRFSRQVHLTGMMGSGGATQVNLPPGFSVTTFAQGLHGPRFLAFGEDDALYVAERGADRILRLSDRDGDGVADGRQVFANEVPSPHSLTQHLGDWFVGVPSGVIHLRDEDGDGRADVREVLIDDYPTGGHSTRTVLFLPDGRMVVSVGSSCNVCEESDPRRAAIVVYDGPQAGDEQLYATGLRNPVGLTIRPETGQLWASNNGRDLMGDDLPPDTIERVVEGGDYGWPRCHSGRIPDPQYGGPEACSAVESPVLELQAHSAPLGLVFYDGDLFPTAFHGDLFVAYHGSWNRSIPTGYKVVRIDFEAGRLIGTVEDFATGWLSPESYEVSGRPVGLAVGPDGALFVTDDKAGFIYRIAYDRTP